MDNTTATSTADNDNASSQHLTRHRGSCHCGAVRFEVTVDLARGGSRCNCSICIKIGGLGVIVAPEALTIVSPEAELGEYAWGGKVSRRYFCKQCGVHTFSRGYLVELGGAFAGVNLNTLDDVDPTALGTSYWDGRHNNWMAGTRPTPWPIFAAAA